MTHFDLVLRGGTIVNVHGRCRTDLGIRGGRIAAIGDLGQAAAAEVRDCTGLHLLPGVIDSQVHFREPGLEHKEDLESGTRGAVLGGVTALFEMPNTKPNTDIPERMADKVARMKDRSWCDFAFYFGGTAVNADRLHEWEHLPGCCGVKVFMGSSTGDLLVADDEHLGRIVANGRRRMAVHCEDEPRLIERRPLIPAGATAHWHPLWRDEITALRATQRLVTLAERHRRKVHVLHVTTAEEMAYLGEHKDWASVEVLVNHLTLAAPDCYDRLGTYAQQNPPVRDARHRDALWKAVADGTVDVLATDHAPHTKAEKDKGYPDSPAGMPGVQTLVPVMLDHVNAGRLSLERFVELTSAGPQRLFQIQGKGRIAVGYDADVTVVDLGAKRTIENQAMATKSGWTPFHGMTVTGWPVQTIIRGRTVMRDGELLAKGVGEAIRFLA